MNIVPSGSYCSRTGRCPRPVYSDSSADQNNIAQSTTDSTTTTIEQPTNAPSYNAPVAVKISQGNATSYNSVQNGTAVHAAQRFTADTNAPQTNSSADRPASTVQKTRDRERGIIQFCMSLRG